MSRVKTIQNNQCNDTYITRAHTRNSSVNDFHALHSRVTESSGENLKPKTWYEIADLIREEQGPGVFVPNPRSIMLGAWQNQGLVGMMSISRLSTDDHKIAKHLLIDRLRDFTGQSPKYTAYFNSFAVDQAVRGQGIGDALLEEAVYHAQNKLKTKNGRPMSFAFAKVAEGNPAIDLFRRHGFFHYGDAIRTGSTTKVHCLARTL